MVGAAERDRKLVADPTSQGPRLHEPQVVGVRGAAPANEARLRRDELEMLAVAVAPRFAQSECAFVDVPGNGIVHPLVSACSCAPPAQPQPQPVPAQPMAHAREAAVCGYFHPPQRKFRSDPPLRLQC